MVKDPATHTREKPKLMELSLISLQEALIGEDHVNIRDKPTEEQKKHHCVADAGFPLACRDYPQLAG